MSPAQTRYRPEFGPDSRQHLSVRGQVAGRYYYYRERCLRQGYNVGGFSATYVSVSLGAGLGKDSHETPFFLYQNNARQFVTADVALLYGLQRRLGRYGFFDANTGVTHAILGRKTSGGPG